MKRKILAITGIRSEYDILYPVLDAIQNHPNLDLELVVCGAHLSPWHGHTIDYIKKDGFKICDKVEYLLSGNLGTARAKGMGILIMGLVQTVERVKPDFLLVVGDREEPLAAAIVSNYLKIPLAHIAGGDAAMNNADDPIRHAVSKIAHIHFTICDEHKERLIKMGEEPFRVINTGTPALDRIRRTPQLSKKELFKMLDFEVDNEEPFIIVLQHPLSSEVDDAYNQMKTTMEAVNDLGIKTVVIYPNTDPGSYDIIKAIEEYRDLPNIKICKNLERLEFINLMRHASCMVGNSSCGLVEAPFLGLPVINVGNRQKGRLNAGNVIFVPHDKEIIKKHIKQLVFNNKFREHIVNNTNKYLYGDGFAGEKIAKVLYQINIDNELLIKKNAY